MRLPRWLLVSLIAVSAVALVAVPAWLWVEVPLRTAKQFIAAIEASDVDTVNRLLSNAKCEITESGHYLRFVLRDEGQFYLRPQATLVPRAAYDVIVGRH